MHTYMNGTSMVVFLLVASGWQTPKREATFSFERMDSQEVVCWHWYMNASAVEGFEFLLILKSLHPFQVLRYAGRVSPDSVQKVSSEEAKHWPALLTTSQDILMD